MNYYNEFDPQMAAWLRELMADGLIPKGDVDERSIADVEPVDLTGYDQCHFFAGIGGWPYALRLAGVPDDDPVWTGSCPCQPFSVAGKRRGTADERHLWPEFHRLITECRPAVVLGEQVAGEAGRVWLAGVRADLEALDYGVGAADLCTAGVGAPHIRQRLYWVAHAERRAAERQRCDVADAARGTQGEARERERLRPDARAGGNLGGLADAIGERGCGGNTAWRHAADAQPPGATNWGGNFARCGDGKARRIPLEPALFPLAHGVPGRVGLLRGAGNAICPPLAAEFIQAALS